MRKTPLFIILVAALIAVIAVGFFILKAKMEKTYNYTLYTKDGNGVFMLEDACASEPERNMGYYAYCAELANPDTFFEDYVSSRPSFLYSVDSANQKSKEETGNYLFFEDNYYYYISVRDNMIYGTELIVSINGKDNSDAFVSFPFIPDNKHISGGYGYLSDSQSASFTWNDAPGIHSFEELAEYYNGISGLKFDKDDKSQTITLPLMHFNEELILSEHTAKLQIKVNDNQITVNYVQNDEK